MSSVLQIIDLSDSQATRSYLTTQTLRSWLLTTDHKRVGLLYLFTIIVFFAVAAVAAAVMRLNLLTPRGDLVQAETYNKLFTITVIPWVTKLAFGMLN